MYKVKKSRKRYLQKKKSYFGKIKLKEQKQEMHTQRKKKHKAYTLLQTIRMIKLIYKIYLQRSYYVKIKRIKYKNVYIKNTHTPCIHFP